MKSKNCLNSYFVVSLCIGILFWSLIGKTSFAGGLSQSFSWSVYSDNSNTDPTIVSTKIHIGTEPGVYSNSEDAGMNTQNYTIDELYCETTYFATATHYIGANESKMSEEISFTTLDCLIMIFNPLPPISESIILSVPVFGLININ